MAGRNSRLKNADFCKSIAEAYITGMSRAEMAEHFDAHKDTITVWCSDPRVQAHAGRLALERINRITRKIDGEMEARLAKVDGWDIEQLLKVRKEYLERAMKVGVDLGGASTGDVSNELSEAMDRDPNLAEALRKLVGA